MEPGDFVEVDYIGRIKDSGKVFDVTKESVAKAENVYNTNVSYKPVVLIVGADFIIKGLDEALRGMNVGDHRKIDIPPGKAFGEKRENLVKIIPLARFKEQTLDPVPGAAISVGSMRGVILSADGGRVRVDFNHPLAGKTLEYDIEVKSEINDINRRVKAVVEYFTNVSEVEVVVKGKEAEIEIKKDVDIVRPVKSMVAHAAMKWCDLDMVKFLEVFEKSSEAYEVEKQESREKLLEAPEKADQETKTSKKQAEK